MATVAVNDANFDAEVRQSDVPVVVDFWAEWCGPCKMIGPALEELSNEYGDRVKIVKVNVDENPNSPAQLGVRGIPALFLFKDGEIVSNRAGAAPKAALKAGSTSRSDPPRGVSIKAPSGAFFVSAQGSEAGQTCPFRPRPPYRPGWWRGVPSPLSNYAWRAGHCPPRQEAR
ncbi:thioredoxin [Limimaricola cinnabarinus LL-001]|uniref:Thioredoxin n=1 Tax=Limimaricola cinnabarinus LL-001 TaxID=1337093 RepID=U3AQR8_9RHOB|nr:thioredoxin [Limimaricola cinnabarinus LL-001]